MIRSYGRVATAETCPTFTSLARGFSVHFCLFAVLFCSDVQTPEHLSYLLLLCLISALNLLGQTELPQARYRTTNLENKSVMEQCDFVVQNCFILTIENCI